jgi:hypothetical protein
MLPGLDPETKGLMRLALDEKRQVESGRLPLKDAKYLPEGTRLENGKVIISGAGPELFAMGASVGVFALLILTGALIGSALRWFFVLEVAGVRVYLALGVGLACLTLGATVYWFRDIRSWRSVSVLEVVLAAAGGAVAFVTAADPWSRWIGIGAAAFAVADGLGRLRAPTGVDAAKS